MHFDTKNYLKNNRNYTVKHTLRDKSEYFSWLYATVKGFWDDEIIPCMHSIVKFCWISLHKVIGTLITYDYVMVHYRN
jgi:hypothetical protein